VEHIDFELLNSLAESVEEEEPLTDIQVAAMKHIGECDECYKKFCCLAAIVSATSESGYIALSNMNANEGESVQTESSEIMAVISIAVHKVKESVSVILEQVNQIRDRMIFDMPLAAAARGVSKGEGDVVKKLVDIENDKNIVVVDPLSKSLLVQLDYHDLHDTTVSVYIVLEDGNKINIPLSRKGNVLSGTIENIPDGQYKLYIEQQ
jgi:hypothetical protein